MDCTPLDTPSPVELPSELVREVLLSIQISDLCAAFGVAKDWAAASKDDDFWLQVLQRRWPNFTLDAVNWPSARRAMVALKSWHMPLDEEDLVMRRRVRHDPRTALHFSIHSDQARDFVSGLASGFMPRASGIFTFHGEGLTPIHYRHIPADGGCGAHDDDDDESPMCTRSGRPAQRLRMGGRWQWSPDACEWFETSCVRITRGLFAAGGAWDLAEANVEIVEYLHAWPLVPFWRAPLQGARGGGLDAAFWARVHGALLRRNTQLREAFEAVVFDEAPTSARARSATAAAAATRARVRVLGRAGGRLALCRPCAHAAPRRV